MPDGRRPEAEWGFDPALLADLELVTARAGYQLRRLEMDEPQDISGLVAEVYRSWYRRRGMSGQRLLVESYVQWDPLWVLRTGVVPFWCRFNMQPDHQELKRYLDSAEPYEEIFVNLFSQGLWSPGVVPISQWRQLAISRATVAGDVIGVDEDSYPIDPGSTLRFQPAFAAITGRHPLPAPLDIADLDRF